MHNHIRIPIEQLNEQEGTIEFVVKGSYVSSKNIPSIRILEIVKDQTVFILERDSNFFLKFIQSNPNYKTKIAKINLQDFNNASSLYIALTWSKKENAIYVGEYGGNKLRKSKSFEEPNIKFRIGWDGKIYQIGEESVQVGYYKVKNGKEVILEPTAKEIFDFQMEKIKILIDNCKKGDFLFESILVQQIIVMLTTAFEVYTRTRFLELEKEGKVVNIEALYKYFFSDKYREQNKKEVVEKADKQGKTELEVFVEKINFQN